MTDQTETCPLCAFSADSEADVYTHVLTSHRKQAITDVLLETHAAHSPRR